MIEIGCQTYSLRALTREEMLASARKAGFRSVELWVGHADYQTAEAAPAAVRRAADDVGLGIQAYSVGGFARVAVGTVAARLAAAFAYAAGLGVEVDFDRLTLLGEYDTYRAGMLLNHRPDGSFTNW